MTAQFRFAKLQMNKPQTLKNVLWTDETKAETFGFLLTCCCDKQLISTNTSCQHGGGGMMI